MKIIDADKLPRHGQRGGLVHWKDIENAPTIEPKQEWIPCEERLPKSGYKLLLITAEVPLARSTARCIDLARFVNGEWTIEGKAISNKVVAWMPLPKPYERSE